MSFIDGFYTFNIDLVNVENNIYDKLFLKIPKHPNESFEELISKVLAYCHSYKKELTFSDGDFSPSDPTIWQKDVIGNILSWIQVGAPSYKKIHKAIQQNSESTFKIYFYDEKEPNEFCYDFRSVKTQDFNKIKFFLIDNEFVEKLTENISTRMNWNISFIDDMLYLHWDKLEFESKIVELNIWDIYQETIANL